MSWKTKRSTRIKAAELAVAHAEVGDFEKMRALTIFFELYIDHGTDAVSEAMGLAIPDAKVIPFGLLDGGKT